jgi:hypothetical protein
MKVTVIDCSVTKNNLPARLPKDISGRLERVLSSEAENSSRVSRFYREQAKEYADFSKMKVEVEVKKLEEIRMFSPKSCDAIIMPDSYYTPTREAEE